MVTNEVASAPNTEMFLRIPTSCTYLLVGGSYVTKELPWHVDLLGETVDTLLSAGTVIDVLRQFIPFAWHRTDKHQNTFAEYGYREKPLRLIDMALWFTRDNNP